MKTAFAFVAVLATSIVSCASPRDGAAAPPAPDALSAFFHWWNEAYEQPGSYTAEAFGRHLTPDATLVLEGRETIRGLDGWAKHFQKIQAGGGDVELVVPFRTGFQQGDRIYTYHVIRSRRDGKVSCSLAAGHAELRGGRIATIVLVRSTLDPERAALDPECWKK